MNRPRIEAARETVRQRCFWLTATGMSDILPVHPVARMLCSLEMITGILFIAVLIARLAGSYPPREG